MVSIDIGIAGIMGQVVICLFSLLCNSPASRQALNRTMRKRNYVTITYLSKTCDSFFFFLDEKSIGCLCLGNMHTLVGVQLHYPILKPNARPAAKVALGGKSAIKKSSTLFPSRAALDPVPAPP